ncbi:hypothetical protein VC279_19080 [Xanthomonas sp. WHRI 10064A]|nr:MULTISPECIES: hypothetical protein [unclassified Xanthomonas]MEA9589350.1 hypothetical protein [Xanthomonas sp. WHRI 10064B]MEA9616727.1 hypothetical protein [Xanthomonas sp. WHRI 10064A]
MAARAGVAGCMALPDVTAPHRAWHAMRIGGDSGTLVQAGRLLRAA